MKPRFKNNMIIHCPERQQALWLIAETEVPERNCKEEAIAGWDKYREKTVYGLMGEPSYEAPTLVLVCSMDDEIMEGKVITEYADLYS